MRRILLTLLLVGGLCRPALLDAGTVALTWTPVADAQGYRIYRCVVERRRLCTQWTLFDTIADGGTGGTVFEEATENALVLYRIAAFNAAGETLTRKAGGWYDGRQS